ncbi:efflux RND transporter periplasmic adaptor subunit [Daejeonella sp. H1SJ63]|uniref:efflux RND transporter periplasmic adaptor subunit n=1 Tax=Daejeonella sp. H1SJ63 TaxID=3034145 RepID=UPI0023EE0F4F|nr:efflux RND transporter periplasmic adaptor subunit [Daejeonella sp. H1SJ63]
MRYLLIFFVCLLWACSEKKHDTHTVNDEVNYTCSMHPQVMVSKPGNCPICQMPLIQVSSSATPDKDELQLSDQQIHLGNISVDTIRSGDIGSQTVLTAVLNYDQTKTSAISSRVMGRIERLYFKNTGDYVRNGDRLYDIYSEELNNAKQEYLKTRERRRILAGNELIDFAALEQSAENKLRLWGMNSSQIKQLVLTGKADPTTTFYSTGSGYITALNILQGDYVMEGGTIVELVDLSTLWAEAQVYASQFSSLAQDAPAIVRIPDMANEEIPGRINFVNPEIVSGSRINLVRVSIPNRNKRLKPGMPAYVYLSNTKHLSFTLPVDAVIRDTKGATVWVQTGKNTFKSKMVELGGEANNKVEIKSGLLPGDLVVVTGAYLLNSEYIFKMGVKPMEGHNM